MINGDIVKKLLLSLLLFIYTVASGQTARYSFPTDSLVASHLDHWQDLKFGLLMHWGTYSQWGIVESWSICPEDEDWTKRKGTFSNNYFNYLKAYEGLQKTFNPVEFNPAKWAAAANYAGMKYVIFTTKHHDGFCMFDTRQTDYKVTSQDCPFSRNPKRNIAKEIFDAFRKEGLMAGAYFSKPDWHNDNYWWSYFPPKDRNVNYDPVKYPDKWNAFKDFTFQQIRELMTEYGKMDILWLDGGWVRPRSSIDTSIVWQREITYDQDIDMKHIVKMARGLQPGLIIVDRSVGGEFENYTTPEQEVPPKPLNHPWETCMTMASSWSYVENDHYKTTQQLITLLIQIVAKGGNLLLNIGPSPQGDWDTLAYARLREIGNWMKINGEGIYNSRPLYPYGVDNICYTQSKDSLTNYVFYILPENGPELPVTIDLGAFPVNNINSVFLLGNPKKIKWAALNGKLIVTLPKSEQKIRSHYALVFKIIRGH